MMSLVNAMELALSNRRGPMKEVRQATEGWIVELGNYTYNVRSGITYFGGDKINWRDIGLFLRSGSEYNGWLNGTGISCGIASYRKAVQQDGVNVISHSAWDNYLNGKDFSSLRPYWGGVKTNVRIIIVYRLNHWYLLAVFPVKEKVFVLDSIDTDRSEKKRSVNALMEILKNEYANNHFVVDDQTSAQQYSVYDCGIYVVMNAKAIIENIDPDNPIYDLEKIREGLDCVDVDWMTRKEIIQSIRANVDLGRNTTIFNWQAPKGLPQPPGKDSTVIELEDENDKMQHRQISHAGGLLTKKKLNP